MNGGADITDGQLNLTFMSPGLKTLSLHEAGDYTLLGGGTAATSAFAGAILRATVTEINGAAVAPIVLAPSNASVGFNLAANSGVTQPWSLGTSINVFAIPLGVAHARRDRQPAAETPTCESDP